MNVKMIQNGLISSIAPLAAIALSCYFWDNFPVQVVVITLAALAQLVIVFLCKRSARDLIRPSVCLMERMEVPPMPAPLQRHRYVWDCRISAALAWLSVPAPVSVLIAKGMENGTLSACGLSHPVIVVLLLGLFCVAAATVSQLFWVRAMQANEIYSTFNDRERYLLRGFAEVIDKPGYYHSYLLQRQAMKLQAKHRALPSES